MATLYQRPESAVWWCRFRINGKDYRKSTGETDRAKAQKCADAIELETSGPNLRLSKAIERYLDEAKNVRQTTKSVYKGAVARILKYDDPKLSQIDSSWLRKYVAHSINAGRGQVSIRLGLSALSAVMRQALMWPDAGVTSNPVRGFPRDGLARIRSVVRYLTDDQRAKLLAAIPEGWRRNIVILALETGMRFGELRNLRWSYVFLADSRIVLPGHVTKSGRGRTIPLSKETVRVLCAQSDVRLDTVTLVFHDNGKQVTRHTNWWYTARKAAKLTDIRIHDLRHTFASRWVQRGRRADILQNILGHSSPTMTSRYAHLRDEDLQAELERIQNT